MISHLGIRGLGVIRAADVDLAPGLVVFTGETGAGKTMLVSALGLILGDRFDSGLLGAEGRTCRRPSTCPPTVPLWSVCVTPEAPPNPAPPMRSN